MLDVGYVLLAVAVLVGLLFVPLGLPGLWVMLAAGIAHRLLVAQSGITWTTIVIVGALAVVAEYLEFYLSVRYTRKYGGSRRAGWGALLGGLVGAIVGVPVPITGSVIGGLAGSFLGALLAEYSVTRHAESAHRAALGSLIGRVASIVLKIGIGVAIGAILLISGFGGR